MVTAARCECTTYGNCAVCRPVLPSPRRPYTLPPAESLPTFSRILDDPKIGLAMQRMADVVDVGSADIAIGLYHFFAVLEGDQ